MLALIVEGALYFWMVEFLPEYSSRIHYYFSMTILFCGILLLASLALSKGKPIFRSYLSF